VTLNFLFKTFKEHSLGFERKARLFCDVWIMFVDSSEIMLGFERKARLFCDNFALISKGPKKIISKKVGI